MKIDLEMQAILERNKSLPKVDWAAMPLDECRARVDGNARYWNEMPQAVARVSDHSIEARGKRIRVRLYEPSTDAAAPALVFAHGGGWTGSSIDTHDGLARSLAVATGAAVLSVDYALSPEHVFPAGRDDVLAVLDAAAASAFAGAVDPSRIGLVGDSAGAHVVLSALVAAAQPVRAVARAAALLYGCFEPAFDTQSHRLFGDGTYGLTTERMRFSWDVLTGRDPAIARIASLSGWSVEGLPRTYIAAAGLDCLRDDSFALFDRLIAAEIDVTMHVLPGIAHGFIQMGRDLAAARRTIDEVGAFFRSSFAL